MPTHEQQPGRVVDKNDYRVIVLGEDNYTTWKWHMNMVLKTKGLYEAATKKDYKDQTKIDQATALIASTLSMQNMQRVINCDNAFDIWTSLESTFENKSSTERSMLLEKFTSYRIRSISEISKAIGDIQAKAAKLKSLGAAINDETIISVILKALPESMKSWKSTWKMVNADKLELNKLITALMAEVSDMKKPEDSALLARGRFKPIYRSSGKPRLSTLAREGDNNGPNTTNDNNTCNYCKKPGHWARDCRLLQSNKQKGILTASKQKSKMKSKNFSSTARGVAMMAVSSYTDTDSCDWIADSGSSMHMTSNFNWISQYKEFSQPKQIRLGDGRCIPGMGKGHIDTEFGQLLNVHYVPDLSANLFSISAAASNGIKAIYSQNGIVLTKFGKSILEGKCNEGVYVLNINIKPPKYQAMTAETIDEWHRKLGHVSKETIRKMQKMNVVDDLIVKNESNNEHECSDCALAKCKRASHPISESVGSNIPGAVMHFDTVGPFKEESLGGSKYFLIAKDEASSYKFVKPVASKTEIGDSVKGILSKSELETGNKTLKIVTDNGSEFVNENVKRHLRNRGIHHQLSVPYTPQQNGFIEREIRTVVESARTMLNRSKLPKSLWAEAVSTAVYLLNRTLVSCNTITPYEKWIGKRPSLKNLHVFGQDAVVLYRDYKQSKWDEKGVKQKFVGYTDKVNTYRFYDPDSEQVYVSCDAKFLHVNQREIDQSDSIDIVNENHDIELDQDNMSDQSQLNESINRENTFEELEMSWDNYDSAKDISTDSLEDTMMSTETVLGAIPEKDDENRFASIPGDNTILEPSGSNSQESVARQRKAVSRLDKIKSPSAPLKLSDIHPGHILIEKLRSNKGRKEADESKNLPGYHAKLVTTGVDVEPKTYAEAMLRNDKKHWRKAMEEEMESLYKNNVWTLVERPTGNIVTNRWVFKLKKRPDGSIERYKARLVARGFTQKPGVDYFETYAPVANMTSVRMLFAYASGLGLEMIQFDIKTAFLYGDLEETVYMEQPQGFEKGNDKVCLLKRSLYGLKQSPRQWNKKFSDFLTDMNLTVSEHDGCIFYRMEPLVMIAIYVDDGMIFAEDKNEINKIIKQLSELFEVHIVKSSMFLGFQFHRSEDGKISLNQKNYIETILKRFNMEDCKSVDCPTTLTKTTEDTEPLDKTVPYREAIGSLMYAAVITRLDIAHAVGLVSRNVESPTNEDWKNVKRIFRYLKGRENFTITYGANQNRDLYAFCDADFAGDKQTSRSTTGNVIIYNGGPVHWKSHRQALITLSSTEAEFVSLCSAVKEIIWIRKLSLELGMIKNVPTIIYCDNSSALRIASNEKSVHRTRHMSVQASYPREQIDLGNIEVQHVPTDQQLADMLTKPTTVKKFVKNVQYLMNIITSFIMYVILVRTLVTPCHAYVFDGVSPIIWIPLENEVEIGVTTLNIELTSTSPCDTIPSTLENRFALGNFEANSYERTFKQLRKDCDDFYDLHWKTRLMELQQTIPEGREEPRLPNARRRRAVVAVAPIVGFVAAAVITIAIVTNILSYLVGLTNPYSDTRRLGVLESQQEIDQRRIDELNSKFNASQVVEKGMLDSMKTYADKFYEMDTKLEKLHENLPRVAWMASYLQKTILDAGTNLESIIREYKHNRVSTRALGSVLNMSSISSLNPDEVEMVEVARQSMATTFFKLEISSKSADTAVYEVFAFSHWVNLTTVPELMRYTGAHYLIHNTTSNCIKAIDEPKTRTIQNQCREQEWRDHKLSLWEGNTSWRDADTLPIVKRVQKYNYIYCYNHTIVINNHRYACPTTPFKLPITTKFSTTGYNHEASVMRVTSRGPKWKMVDTSLTSAFLPYELSNDLQMLQTVTKLRETFNSMNLLRGAEESSKTPSWIFGFIIAIIGILIAVMSGLWFINWRARTVIKKHNRKYHESLRQERRKKTKQLLHDSHTSNEESSNRHIESEL